MSDNTKVNSLLHRVGDAVNWRAESDQLAFHADVDDTFPVGNEDDGVDDNDAAAQDVKAEGVKPSPSPATVAKSAPAKR